MTRKRTCPDCSRKVTYDTEECRCGHRFTWRRPLGAKGFNRVWVYERQIGGRLQVSWTGRDGDHRETLTNLAGVPIFDQDMALRLGQRLADKQAKHREAQTASELLDLPKRRSVGELFAQLHNDKKGDWSTKYHRDQKRFRRFWEAALGRSTDITDVTPSLVANAVRKENEARERDPKRQAWSLKTQNHYLNAAVETWGYAERHLKWITPAQNLEAVKRHQVDEDNSELAYQTAEVHMLLPTLEEIDLRAWACGELAYIGGRRITAIRTLPSGCYRTESRIMPDVGAVEFGVVTFPARTDKARKRGAVYLVGAPKRAIEALLATPSVQASGHLFPKGDLSAAEPPPLPITAKVLRAWLREAEDACGVAQIDGRSYHAFKRAFATDAEGSLEGASAQSGTTEETLRRIYRQPKPEEKAALALQLDGLRRRA